MKHTKGPWKVYAEYNIENEEHVYVATCGMNAPSQSGIYERCKANAQLIASAPRLFEENLKLKKAVEKALDKTEATKILKIRVEELKIINTELLETCKEALEVLEDIDNPEHTNTYMEDMLKQTIAKAELG